MTRQPNRDRPSRWLGLMYATGALLIVCGIPATAIISIVFRFAHDRSLRLDNSQALLFGGSMIAAEIVIASVLLYAAEKITKRRRKMVIKNDDADA